MHTESYEYRGVSHVGEFRDYDEAAVELWKKSIRESTHPRDRLTPEDCLTLAAAEAEPQPDEPPAPRPRTRSRK